MGIWRPSKIGVDRAVTMMVDLSRDQDGCLHARLLDAVVGRSGAVYKAWLNNQPEEFIDGIEHALDPFRGYANAIHDRLPDAVAVLDAFHVVRLGSQMVDEVRRRVQLDTLGICGHKRDALSDPRAAPPWCGTPHRAPARQDQPFASALGTHQRRSMWPGSVISSCA
jgi:transposase